MSDSNPPPIIVIRKKGGHGGHHGGAWKVAYADFVTAMMALFIVLWLMNSSEKIQKAISAYFRDPSGAGKLTGSASAGSGESISVNKDNMTELKDRLQQALKRSPDFEKLKDYVQMSVTGEGLRVEMLESEKGTFFESGSAMPSEAARDLIAKMAAELGSLPNNVLIEGHTDSRPFSAHPEKYSNWELSTDRANAARRLMESTGLRDGQVLQVRGFADQQLRDKEHPEAAANRRISVIVRYQDTPPPDAEPDAAPGGEGAKRPAEGKPAAESKPKAAAH
jgi:chemotaxis protein MotB